MISALLLWLLLSPAVALLLGAEPGDTLDDLFPGTGAVAAAWRE